MLICLESRRAEFSAEAVLDDGAADGDVDDLCGAAGLEGEGDGGEVFVGGDGDDFAFDGLEALEGDAEGVRARGDAGEGEVAGGVREGFSGVAGGFAGEGDLGAEDIGTAGIDDDADDGAGVELGEEERREREQKERERTHGGNDIIYSLGLGRGLLRYSVRIPRANI